MLATVHPSSKKALEACSAKTLGRGNPTPSALSDEAHPHKDAAARVLLALLAGQTAPRIEDAILVAGLVTQAAHLILGVGFRVSG